MRRAEAPRLSLSARVALALACVMLAGGVAVALAAFAYGHQAARTAYDRLLVGAASSIAAAVSVQDGTPVTDLPVAAFDLLALAPDDRIRYAVIGPGGTVLTGEGTALPGGILPATGPPAFFDGDMDGEAARYVAVTRRFAERDFAGDVHVVVGQTVLARRALALEITRGALLILALTGIAVAVLAAFAVRSALSPMARIGAVLRARDPYDLTPVTLPVPREAAVMLGALNGFMARLDRQVASMVGLIEDTAHQLRTPVAAIRAQAELAADAPDPARRDRAVGRIRSRARTLGRLLDQMLNRALVIHRTDSVAPETFDLRDVAIEAVEEAEEDAGMAIGLDLPDGAVTLTGDRLSLSEALRNLIHNALHHGRPPVRVGVAGVAEGAELWVCDRGAGPPEAVRRAGGERFARSAMSGPASAGLGLAIAHEAARGHGGTLRLESPAPGGFRAAMTLPRRRRPG